MKNLITENFNNFIFFIRHGFGKWPLQEIILCYQNVLIT